jgi:hypothetical protein
MALPKDCGRRSGIQEAGAAVAGRTSTEVPPIESAAALTVRSLCDSSRVEPARLGSWQVLTVANTGDGESEARVIQPVKARAVTGALHELRDVANVVSAVLIRHGIG